MVINIKCTRAPGMYPFLKDGHDDGGGGVLREDSGRM